MTKTERAYIAGLFDGEAGFQIKKYRDKKQILGYGLCVGIRVSNTHKGVLLFLKEKLGGSVSEHKLSRNIGRWKQAFRWQLTSRKAMNVVKQIYPFLIIKKQQAKIMLRFDKTITDSTKRLSEKIMTKRWALKNEINILNKRGL